MDSALGGKSTFKSKKAGWDSGLECPLQTASRCRNHPRVRRRHKGVGSWDVEMRGIPGQITHCGGTYIESVRVLTFPLNFMWQGVKSRVKEMH